MAEIRGGDLVTADSVLAEGVVATANCLLFVLKTRWTPGGKTKIWDG